MVYESGVDMKMLVKRHAIMAPSPMTHHDPSQVELVYHSQSWDMTWFFPQWRPVFLTILPWKIWSFGFSEFSPSSEHPNIILIMYPMKNIPILAGSKSQVVLVGESHDKSPWLSHISLISTLLTLNSHQEIFHLRTFYKWSLVPPYEKSHL